MWRTELDGVQSIQFTSVEAADHVGNLRCVIVVHREWVVPYPADIPNAGHSKAVLVVDVTLVLQVIASSSELSV